MDVVEVDSDRFVCELSAESGPACEVPCGSVLRIRTRSACDRHVGAGPVRADGPNPSTGPIAVTSAEPGHALAIEVLDIVPASVGHISAGPKGGHREIAVRDGTARFGESIRVPIAPMIGVLGTAPASGSWNTMDCGPWGGNMDTKDIAPGATVFLPVFRPKGLFVLGDVHAVMADGEIGGQGLEVAAEVLLRVDVEETPLTDAVYLYRGDEIMTIGVADTLDEACAAAARAMAEVLGLACGMDEFTAGKLLGLAGDVRVGQLCCTVKSARVAVPVDIVPGLARPRRP